jgi:FkbM family methyltransferase
MIRRLAALLPRSVQHALRRGWYSLHIKRGRFTTDEPEFGLLHEWIAPGDCVLDVGANLGVYTRRMSELVGPTGRVVSLEPVPTTFELLSANTADLGNVTLIQAAAGIRSGTVHMTMPYARGLPMHYRAHVSSEGEFSVLSVRLADLPVPPPSLIKIDAEGSDLDVLMGMPTDPPVPVLIVEDNSPEVVALLTERGYKSRHIEGSPNLIWRWDEAHA